MSDSPTIFSDAQIADQIAELSGYEVYEDIATLSAVREVSPEVLTAFANLAKALKLSVVDEYGTLKIKRRRPDNELHAAAIDRLQRKYERGEIEAGLI